MERCSQFAEKVLIVRGACGSPETLQRCPKDDPHQEHLRPQPALPRARCPTRHGRDERKRHAPWDSGAGERTEWQRICF